MSYIKYFYYNDSNILEVMISKIEIKLVDEEGNYSIAYIDYKGYMNMLFNHKIDMVHDALEGMVVDYRVNGRMEIKKKESAIESEVKEALLKEEGRRDQ
jgi:hypothetical protein